ncbi:MAG: HAD family hydrolase [Eubacteriaceae bacterium]
MFKDNPKFKNVKAVMADVDGTLLDSHGKVTPKTIEAIRKLRDNGILFGLSTGRDAVSCMNLLENWGIDGLVDVIIGMGGGEIYDLTRGTDSASYPLDGRLIHDIMDHYKDMDLNFCIPSKGVLYAPKDDEMIRRLSKADKLPYEVVDFDELLKTPQGKVMIVCDPSLMDAVVERAKTFDNPDYKSASLKTASILYEYMDPRVSKSNGLREFMESHGWTLDELMTFGDEDNDEDMTRHAGIGVVMENGSTRTKAAADYITLDNDSDGIADFLEKAGLV